MFSDLINELNFNASESKAKQYRKFFKESYTTTKFIGIKLPEQRKIAKKYSNLPASKIQKLLNSEIHEYKMTSLLILILKYEKAKKKQNIEILQEIVNFYLKNAKKINNWDFVDVSAPKIIGDYFLNENKKTLYDLAKSNNIWERRISIVSTLTFIKRGKLGDTFKLSEILINDKHDLIHKAVGWMLREVGKRDRAVLLDFIKSHYKEIPRTTLRYSVERFSEKERKNILKGNFNN